MRLVSWGVGILLLSGSAVLGQTQCATYTIRADDSLREISNTAYGNASFYQLIYDANRALIGPDPGRLVSGLVINIPCSDGSISERDFVPSLSAEDSQSSDSPAPLFPFERPMRIAVAHNLAPFSSGSLPGGGMVPELVTESIAVADPGRETEFIFVAGLNSDLPGAFQKGRFDLALPVYRPDCTNLGPLDPYDRALCTDFFASRALYELIVGMYGLNGGEYANAQQFDDLKGARVCRAEGNVVFDLIQAGLVEPDVTFVLLPSVDDCVVAVLNGWVDVLSINALEAEKAIGALDGSGSIVEISTLSTRLSMHAMTPKNNPLGRPYLTVINNGFRDVLQAGKWFGIVSRHMKEFQDR